jgi:hypothetical protein
VIATIAVKRNSGDKELKGELTRLREIAAQVDILTMIMVLT